MLSMDGACQNFVGAALTKRKERERERQREKKKEKERKREKRERGYQQSVGDLCQLGDGWRERERERERLPAICGRSLPAW